MIKLENIININLDTQKRYEPSKEIVEIIKDNLYQNYLKEDIYVSCYGCGGSGYKTTHKGYNKFGDLDSEFDDTERCKMCIGFGKHPVIEY